MKKFKVEFSYAGYYRQYYETIVEAESEKEVRDRLDEISDKARKEMTAQDFYDSVDLDCNDDEEYITEIDEK
jgi:hypothetical protein